MHIVNCFRWMYRTQLAECGCCEATVSLPDHFRFLGGVFDLEPGNSSIIVWKGNRPNLRPPDGQKRMRDIRPGDKVKVFGAAKVPFVAGS